MTPCDAMRAARNASGCETVFLGDGPVVGFGNPALAVPAATPWAEIIVTSVVSAAAGWALDEAATRFSGRKRKKRR